METPGGGGGRHFHTGSNRDLSVSRQSVGTGVVLPRSRSGSPTVYVINSVISDNRAEAGGAIYIRGHSTGMAPGGRLAMTNSTISGNVATTSGGGLLVGGDATITNSTISANVAMDASGGGGGIYNEALQRRHRPSGIRPALWRCLELGGGNPL